METHSLSEDMDHGREELLREFRERAVVLVFEQIGVLRVGFDGEDVPCAAEKMGQVAREAADVRPDVEHYVPRPHDGGPVRSVRAPS